MADTFRALCAELVNELADFQWAATEAGVGSHPGAEALIERARAALAKADEPAVPEGREPAAVTGQPRDEELLRIYGLAKRDHNYEGPIDNWPKRAERAATVAGLRAVLARWGRPASSDYL